MKTSSSPTLSRLVLALVLLVAVSGFARVSLAGPPSFVQQVNDLWKAQGHSQILLRANELARRDPGSTEAYAVLFSYSQFIEGNPEHADAALKTLLSLLEKGHPKSFKATTEFRDQYLQTTGKEVKPPVTADLDRLHKLFPEQFPVQALLILTQLD